MSYSNSPTSSPERASRSSYYTNNDPQPLNFSGLFGGVGRQPSPKLALQMDKCDEFEFEVPEEAPVFVPTAEEFKNPLLYISKIRPVAEKFGICKIKPPSDWTPPFTVDVDKLRFTPRVQRLNELEAKTRIKLNFLDQIAKFWELQGNSLKIPMVERKALDLYSLHRIVQEEGGIELTTKERRWSKIASRMGYPVGKNVGTILKGHYERILYPFDIYTSGKHVDDANIEAGEESDDCDYKPHCIVSRQAVQPPVETTARRSKRVAQIVDQTFSESEMNLSKDKNVNAELRRLQIFGSPNLPANGGTGSTTPKKGDKGDKVFLCPAASPVKQRGDKRESRHPVIHQSMPPQDPLAKYICHICNRGDVEEAMLLCDGCDDSYHTFCLMPPLSDIPRGDWRCPKCVVEEVTKPIEAFGFEQAQREYTLQQFGEMADQFKSDYFNMPVHLVPTDLVEREFWRITSSIDEDVTVEYGADLHTMDHGSGFPTKNALLQMAADQKYADNAWNLNNLPLLEESILGYINADISGMKIPWMYVGMCFATFCWHNEDHWSYSINYLHWGEPKTWYGVPGTAAERFEATMKRAAPELFHTQPDLLHQLVTIMNPNILMAAGVPVYRTDQCAGEFVITFPRAYHAGFNQGYNFAEAVNFAPADWMRMGRDCVNHYSKLRRVCVFSHDELVCKMALESDRLNLGIATACYLDMVEMIDTEKRLRKSLLEWGVTKAEREAFELMQDDERQCDYCKTTCFLSAVTCECAKNLVCLRHFSELCKCSAEKHTLKYRYTLDELPLMLKKLKQKAESFETWLIKVRHILDPDATSKVSFEDVQELALEAEQKKFPGSAVLERLQSAVLEAEKCITVIQQLDINKVRTRTRHSHDTAKYKLTLEELDLFVQEIDHLCCIIADGISVKELQQMGYEFTAKVAHLMEEQSLLTNDADELAAAIQEGNNLCIELPQLEYMRARHEHVLWYQGVTALRDMEERPLHATLKKLIADGMKLVPTAVLEEQLVALQEVVLKASAWEEQVRNVLEQRSPIKLPEMQELLLLGEEIRCYLPSYEQLEEALRRAQDCLDTLEGLQTNENYPYLDTLEFIIQRASQLPFRLEPVQAMEEHVAEANTWRERACSTFLKKHSKYTLLEALTPKYDSDLTFAATPLQSPPSQSSGGSDTELLLGMDGSGTHSSASSTSSSSTISASSSNTSNDSYLEDLGPAIVVATFKKAEQNEVQRLQEIRAKNSAKHPERDLYCLCKGHFMGPMHHCQLCRDWFHVTCVPPMKSTKKGTASEVAGAAVEDKMPDLREKYLCPLCQRTKRPKLETILSLLVALQKIPLRLPEGEALQCVTERAMQWQDRVRQALARKDIAVALAKLSIQQMKKDKSRKAKKLARVAATIEDVKVRVDARPTDSTTMTPSSSETGSDFENLSDVNDDQEVDEELYKTTPEHAYSLMCDKLIFSAQSGPAATPIIHLNKSTQEFLDELMMEGDLLEVSLDETVYLWKILNAAKHRVNELEVIKAKYNIPNESPARVYNEENYKKRKSHDAFFGQPPKKHIKSQAIKTEQEDDKEVELHNFLSLPFSEALTTPIKDEIKSEPETESEGSDEDLSGTEDNEEYTGHNSRKPKPRKICSKSKMRVIKNKKKKFKVVLKDKNEPEVTEESSTKQQKRKKMVGNGTSSTPVSSSPSSPMKKGTRTHRKGKGNEAAASDEDEMCSMSNCAKPSGSEVDWVQCDGGCNKWFHMFCVGMDKTQIRPDVDFICKLCKPPPSTDKSSADIEPEVTTTSKRTKLKGASSSKENKV